MPKSTPKGSANRRKIQRKAAQNALSHHQNPPPALRLRGARLPRV